MPIYTCKNHDSVADMPIYTCKNHDLVADMPINTCKNHDSIADMPICTCKNQDSVADMPISTCKNQDSAADMPICTCRNHWWVVDIPNSTEGSMLKISRLLYNRLQAYPLTPLIEDWGLRIESWEPNVTSISKKVQELRILLEIPLFLPSPLPYSERND